MTNYDEDLDDIQEAIKNAIEAIPGYQPNLVSPDPANCVHIYVMQPSEDSTVLGDFVFAASPYEFHVMMRGREIVGPAAKEAIRGIFSIHQAAEALDLVYTLVKEVQRSTPNEAA